MRREFSSFFPLVYAKQNSEITNLAHHIDMCKPGNKSNSRTEKKSTNNNPSPIDTVVATVPGYMISPKIMKKKGERKRKRKYNWNQTHNILFDRPIVYMKTDSVFGSHHGMVL